VAADGSAPDRTVAGVGAGLVQGVPPDAGAHGGRHDALGIESQEHLPQPVTFGAEEPVGGHLDVVEEQGELIVRCHDLDGKESLLQARAVEVDDEE